MSTLFNVANGETKYLEIPVVDGTIGCQLAWLDSTSSATVTLELTHYHRIAATTAGTAWQWRDSGLTFTGPSGAGAGAVQVNVENVRQRRARLKIVGAAASSFDIQGGLE